MLFIGSLNTSTKCCGFICDSIFASFVIIGINNLKNVKKIIQTERRVRKAFNPLGILNFPMRIFFSILFTGEPISETI